MGKKPKKPDSNSDNGDPQFGHGSSHIFQTLFGDFAEQQTSGSIFSDDNPFRRKPSDRTQTPNVQQQQPVQENQQVGLDLGPGSAEDVGNAPNDYAESPSVGELKKRKRKKDKRAGLDSGSVGETSGTPVKIKKSKKGELNEADLSVKLEKLEVKNGDDLEESVKGGKGNEQNLEKGLKQYEGKNHDIMEGKGMENMKKKKRKRDELEEEYEARRYGEEEGGLGGKNVGEKRKKADDPMDMMVVSKEGFDDEAKLLRTVFVGNLPVKIKKNVLFTEFRQFGDVESVRIRSVPLLDTKKPRKGAIIQKKINDAVDSVHAYIVFKTEEAAEASLTLNMAVVGGNHIRVDRACPPRKKLRGESAPLYDNKRTVFVGNLPFDVKDEEVHQLFSGVKDLESNSIEAIRVIRDPGSSVGKGIAYILFKTRGAANLVARKRGLRLRDRELRLCHAKSNISPSKRKSSLSEERDDYPKKKLPANSRTPDSNNKVKFKAAGSYQGLRANKSGVQKKVHPRSTEPLKLKSTVQSGEKVKERKGKRPAVAARKAKALKGGTGGDGGSKQTGRKRKLENRTPESARARPIKKTKNFR